MNTDKIYAEQIANKYAPKQTSKVKALKKLDAKAKRPATIFAYVFGTLFTLVLGVSMCLCMGVIGPNNALSMTIGIIIGLVGIFAISINYFVYAKILEKSKSVYASDIIKLASEIASEE